MDVTNIQNSKKRKRLTNFDENATIEAQFEAIKAENAKLKREIQRQKATIVDLALANTEMKKGNTDVSDDEETKEERLADVEAELRSKLAETQIQMENERKNFEGKLEELKSDINARDNQIKALKEQTSVLQKVKVEMATTNDDFEERLETEKKAFDVKSNGMEATINSLKQKALKEQTSVLQKVKVEMGTTNDEFEERLETEKKAFEVKSNEMEATINSLTQKDAVWQSETAKLNKMLDSRDNDIKKLKQQAVDDKKVKDELEKQIVDTVAKYRIYCNKYDAKSVKLSEEKSTLQLDVTNAQKTAEEYKKKIEKMENEQQKAHDTINEYKTKIKMLEDKVKTGKSSLPCVSYD
uniref:Uncharacterized protein n=1 Tax=Panagrolaimus sp. ES5 TaxID=591445 RepID=A0AC34G6S5_9BILA